MTLICTQNDDDFLRPKKLSVAINRQVISNKQKEKYI